MTVASVTDLPPVFDGIETSSIAPRPGMLGIWTRLLCEGLRLALCSTVNVYYEASAMIVTLILIGRYMEALSKGRTRPSSA